MFKNYTKQEFFEKMEWEGGFDGMASYCGRVAIIDDPVLEAVWDKYVLALDELEDIFMKWADEDAEHQEREEY